MSQYQKVAHIAVPYLRQTETFIYDRIINHKRYQPFILTDEPVINSALFPFKGNIFSLNERNQIYRNADTLFRKTFDWSPFFFEILKREQPEIVHAHFGPIGAAVSSVTAMARIPLVVSFYGIDASALLQNPYYAKQYDTLFKRASVVSVLSEQMAGRLIAAGCPEDIVRIHRLAVDTKRITPVQVGAKKHPSDPFKIVSAGRLVPKKGMKYLVESFENVIKSGINAELHIYGDGPLSDSIRNLTSEKKLSKRVLLHGAKPRKDVLDAMGNADIFALFSVTSADGDMEGTPTVLIEAAALGIPCVSTRHAGIPEIVIEGKTGFLVDEYDTEDFADRLIQLTERNELRKAMGRAARARAVSKFDIRRVMMEMELTYDSIISLRR